MKGTLASAQGDPEAILAAMRKTLEAIPDHLQEVGLGQRTFAEGDAEENAAAAARIEEGRRRTRRGKRRPVSEEAEALSARLKLASETIDEFRANFGLLMDLLEELSGNIH